VATLANLKKRIGSTVDFNAFFEDVEEYSTASVHPVESGFRVEAMRRAEVPMGVQPLAPARVPIVVNRSQDPPTTSNPEPGTPATELNPEDSSSNISRYDRRYLHPGTVLTLRRGSRGGAVAENLVKYALPSIPEVVVGFVKTSEIAAREVVSHQGVMPINGLAKPFQSSRLNLLCHIHTAIKRLTGPTRPVDLVSIFQSLADKKARSPTIELLHQVVKLSFDWEDLVVIANPFKLPYIEVGMKISDDCLRKCIELMWLEYKTVWFSEMKSLCIPSFAGDFEWASDTHVSEPRASEPRRRRSSSTGERPGKAEVTEGKPKRAESKRSRSILGLARD